MPFYAKAYFKIEKNKHWKNPLFALHIFFTNQSTELKHIVFFPMDGKF